MPFSTAVAARLAAASLAAIALLAASAGCSLFKKNNDRPPVQPAASQTQFQRNAQELAFARRDEQIARRQGNLARRAAQEALFAAGTREAFDPDAPAEIQLELDDDPPDAAAPGRVVDGMVGQVNGQAIYADDIFEPIHAQLRALGRTQPRARFRQQAAQLIFNRLQQLVTDSLIYGEAERDLSENERLGLRQLVENHREELIRRFGRGSVTLANDTVLEEQGKSLNELVEQYRQEVVVRRYLRQELEPRINVTRRDIRRHYDDNLATYQPPQTYAVYFIRNPDPAVVRSLRQRIAAGELTFDQAAAGAEHGNDFRPEQMGLFQEGLRLDDIGEGVLRDTAAGLGDRQVSEPFAFNDQWWLMKLEHEPRGEMRSLTEAQLEIERHLRNQRFGGESARFRRELIRTGSYNPIDQMARDLVDIAITRYARPTQS
jgi:hypothetical protein